MSEPVTVIGSFVSPYVRKVLACLNLKGVAYRVDPMTAFFGGEEFDRLSPLRRIPILVDGDFSIADSSVIAAYLDEKYAGHSLLPSDVRDRARARWFEEYADTRLGDVFLWSLFYQKVVRPLIWGEAGDEARIARALDTDIPAECDYLESEVPAEGFLFGDIGLADISIATFFRNGFYVGVELDDGRWPRLSAYIARVLAHPSIDDLLKFEDVQRSADIKGRRKALLEAGAPLTDATLSTREAQRGKMRL